MKTLFILFIAFVAIVNVAYGVGIGACIGGLCPTGYNCVSSNCILPTSTCVDLLNSRTGVSDCPSRAYLCNNSVYYTLMTQQCPKTCGRCSTSG